jgi:hypothetical protein
MAQTLNISEDTAARMADMRYGCRVDRAAAVFNGAGADIFSVEGGNICLIGFYGEIMVAIDGASTAAISFDVDEAAALDTALGTATGNLNTYVAGRMFTLPAAAGALAISGTCGAAPINVVPNYILPPGDFVLTTTAATTLGTVRWSLWYVPIDPGAYVVAV